MKREYMKRILSTVLSVLIVVSMLVIPASAASYQTVYNKLVALAKTGRFYSGENDYLEGEHYYAYDFETPLVEHNCLYQVVYSTLGNLELRLGCNEKWAWVILPKTPGAQWEIKGVYLHSPISKGSVMIDPATYSSDTQWSFNSYSGDPAYEETLLLTTKFYFGAILDFTSKELAKMGYTLADLGFVQYTDNEAHNWYTIRYWGPSCFQNGFRECICQYCEEERSETIPAYGSHLWDEGSILEEVSCTSEGKILKKCTRCGASKTEVIPALGHAWTLTEILTEPGEGGQHACTGLYSCSRCGETKEAILCAAEVFTDMPSESHWAHKAIDWAWYHGITGGTSPNRFSPNAAINRAQAVTFLWAAAGKPAPESSANPFTDVSADAYYRKAVLWAVEQNITAGSSADSFSPRQTVTRAQTVTFLWAAAGRPEPKSTECPFTDVGASSWYRKAVIWAYENQITGGTGGGCFSPRQNCTRAQVLTFLYKAAPFSTPTPIVESEIEN